MGRSAHRMPRRRILAAALVALAPLVLPSQVAAQSTLTETDSESATVTLDAPGTVTLDAFDPTLGVLTAVTVSLRVEVLVQNCIENTSSDAASMVAGSATASLDAEFPGGANPTEAAVDASVPSTDLAPSNGGNDCAGGFDEAAGRFPASVTAGDTVYFEQTDQADSTDTLTDSDEMAPFIGSETIEVAYTPQSDTALTLPTDWDNVSVAQGQLQASVAYEYTEAAAGGPELPATGVLSNPIGVTALIVVLLGLTALLVAQRRRARS